MARNNQIRRQDRPSPQLTTTITITTTTRNPPLNWNPPFTFLFLIPPKHYKNLWSGTFPLTFCVFFPHTIARTAEIFTKTIKLSPQEGLEQPNPPTGPAQPPFDNNNNNNNNNNKSTPQLEPPYSPPYFCSLPNITKTLGQVLSTLRFVCFLRTQLPGLLKYSHKPQN